MAQWGTMPRLSSPVGILGSGAAATAFARSLAARGMKVCVWSRRPRRSGELAEGIARESGHELAKAVQLDELAQLETVLVGISDPALAEVAGTFAAFADAPAEGAVALHLSGFHDTSVLAPLAACGWSTGGLHPLVSLPPGRPFDGPPPLVGAWFGLAGVESARARGAAIVETLEGNELALGDAPEDRARYHAAASLVAGGTAAIIDTALSVVAGALPTGAARAGFAALAASVLRNLADAEPHVALSGPAARGDREVVEGHLASFAGARGTRERKGTPESSAEVIYRVLTLRMLAIAGRGGRIDPDQQRELEDLLRALS